MIPTYSKKKIILSRKAYYNIGNPPYFIQHLKFNKPCTGLKKKRLDMTRALDGFSNKLCIN